MSYSSGDDRPRARLPTVTEASVTAMLRLRSSFKLLEELISLYESFDTDCKGEIPLRLILSFVSHSH